MTSLLSMIGHLIGLGVRAVSRKTPFHLIIQVSKGKSVSKQAHVQCSQVARLKTLRPPRRAFEEERPSKGRDWKDV